MMIDAITLALLKKYHKGANGSDGADGSSSYKVIEQMSAKAIWQINHEMNKFPSVTVIDSAGSVCCGDINYIDKNNLEITFSAPFSGKCILN